MYEWKREKIGVYTGFIYRCDVAVVNVYTDDLHFRLVDVVERERKTFSFFICNSEAKVWIFFSLIFTPDDRGKELISFERVVLGFRYQKIHARFVFLVVTLICRSFHVLPGKCWKSYDSLRVLTSTLTVEDAAVNIIIWNEWWCSWILRSIVQIASRSIVIPLFRSRSGNHEMIWKFGLTWKEGWNTMLHLLFWPASSQI